MPFPPAGGMNDKRIAPSGKNSGSEKNYPENLVVATRKTSFNSPHTEKNEATKNSAASIFSAPSMTGLRQQSSAGNWIIQTIGCPDASNLTVQISTNAQIPVTIPPYPRVNTKMQSLMIPRTV